MGQRAKYENKNPVYRFLVNRFLLKIKKAVNSLPEIEKVLDVGCAEGFVIKYLREDNPHLKFYGTDIDREALDAARQLNPGVVFENKSIFDVDSLKEKFDLVMALEILEHLKDFNGAFRVLKNLNPTFFLLSVPNEPFFKISNFLRGKYLARWGNHPEHINTWRKREFKKIVSDYFDIIGDFSSFPWIIVLAKKR